MANVIDENLIQLQPTPLLDVPGIRNKGTDLLINQNESVGLDQATLNQFTKKVNKDGNTKVCKIIKVFPKGSPPKAGSPLDITTTLQEIDSKPIIQATAINVERDFVLPYPENALDMQGIDKYTQGLFTYVYSDDAGIVSKNLKSYDLVRVRYVSLNEAYIESIVTDASNVPASSEPSPSSVQGDSSGQTLGSNNNNTTGDVTQDLKASSANPKEDEIGQCGIQGNSTYPLTECKTAKLEANGQTVTLHPVFWDKLNNLLKEIKSKHNVTINCGEAIRTINKQLNYRRERCPIAFTTTKQGYTSQAGGKRVQGTIGGEEWMRSAKWDDVINQFKCKKETAVAAAVGPFASNHLIGLAVDLKMQTSCEDSRVNIQIWERCRSGLVFNLINKYASNYGILNLKREPWHWSYNGG